MNKGKLLSWVITFTLVLSSFAAVPMTASAQLITNGDWVTGGNPTIWTTGAGIELNPYQIGSAEQLAYLAKQYNDGTEDYSDVYYKLVSDIDLEAHYWVPIGNADKPFDGHFDGGDSVINYLKIDDDSTDCQGLFGSVADSGSLTNITLSNVDVKGRDYVGGLAGESNGSISNCTVGGTISGGSYVGGLVGSFTGEALQCMTNTAVTGGSNFAGGLIGSADGATVDQCYSLGTVSGGATNMGGLIGMAGESMTTKITDCYSMAAVAGIADDAARRVGGLIGSSGNCLITNSYSCGLVEEDEYSDLPGGLIGEKSSDTKITNSYYDFETTEQDSADTGKGIPRSTADMTPETTGEAITTATYVDWNFDQIWLIHGTEAGYPALAWLGDSGEGEDADCIIPDCDTPISEGGFASYQMVDGVKYYEVTNAKQLAHIQDHFEDGICDLEFVQTTNIDLGPEFGETGWTALGGLNGTFTGTYLGKGYKINNLYFREENSDGDIIAALFSRAGSDALIKGVNLNIGYLSDSIEPEEVPYKAAIDSPDIYIGGIVGINEAKTTIDNCTVNFELGMIADNPSGNIYFGGIAAYNAGSITNCKTYTWTDEEEMGNLQIGTVGGDVYVGGIAGYDTGVIRHSDHQGLLYATNENPRSRADVEEAFAQNIYVGGIVGYADASIAPDDVEIENCQNNGNVWAQNISHYQEIRACAGGIVGYIDQGADEPMIGKVLEGSVLEGNPVVIIKNCANINDGGVNDVRSMAQSALSGGILGASRFTPGAISIIENCYNRSDVESYNVPINKTLEEKDYSDMCIGLAAGGIVGAAGGISILTSYSTAHFLIDMGSNERSSKTTQSYAGGIAGLIWDTDFTQNYYLLQESVDSGIGGAVVAVTPEGIEIQEENYPDYAIVQPWDDPAGVTSASAANLQAKSFFGDQWRWYSSGAQPEDYYDAQNPWRYITSDGFPVLRGPIYTPPVVTPDGGNHGGGGGSHTVVTTTPAALNKIDHFAYVVGYPDGTVKPLGTITREEVAVIFYRLMTVESRKAYDATKQPFSDVSSDRWSNDEIATLYNAKIITGNADGSFKPAEPISRAEFAAIAAKFDKLEKTQENKFSDISNHWAKDYINSSAVKGWIGGYEDGTFRPDNNILRCEAMKMINEELDRRVDAAGLLTEARQWTDNAPDKWYYDIVLESTNTHDYERANTPKSIEKWTKIKADPVW